MEDSEEKKKTIRWRVAEALLIVIVLIVYGVYLKEKHTEQVFSTEPIEVLAMPITPQEAVVSSSYIGFVTPIEDVDITSYISGYLDEVLVKGGDEVKKDDILLIVRQDEYKAQLDLSNAQVLKAQANLDNASSYYDRIIKAGSKAISQSNIDDAKAQLIVAVAALEEARANSALAKVNLDYTVIKSPINGVVGNVSLTKGNYVSPASQTLFSIVQCNPIRVVFSITDKEYIKSSANAGGYRPEKVKLRLSDGSIYAQNGRVEYIDNRLDKNTGSLAVYAEFENKGRQLITNAYVDVMVEKSFKNIISINQKNLTLTPKGSYVTVANSGKFRQHNVDILGIEGNNYIIANTFDKGDMLVLSNVQNIRPEQKVIIKSLGTKGE